MLIKLIGILALGLGLAMFPQPEKEYSAKLTANEWQIVVNCIVAPDDVSPNQRKTAFQKLFPQIQQQLAADTIKKK